MVSGREPHAEKITVYLTPEEFVDLEEMKLKFRKDGVKADRGKIVRASILHGIQNTKEIRRLLEGGD